ncbi:hypothetical protein LTR36_002056 [Oleoguttula mirabilis]|uniref:Uncharacterized protein n=1 Tax=Oleoguttula mirabilis TaxID=1507867 RepID=A0AAV9JLJ4_9PEZI|nr:hypothetical protein LTR36_002056 [Oleoguttula mirabilis]
MEGEHSCTFNPFQIDMLTDADIFTGDLDALRGDRLLQVAATHTNAEIIDKLEAGHGESAITAEQLRARIHRGITNIAKRDGRPREDVKAEFDAARLVGGVKQRRHVLAGARAQATRVAGLATQQADGGAGTSEENDGEGEVTGGAGGVDSMAGDVGYDALTPSGYCEVQLRQMEVHGLFGPISTAIMDDDVLQLAGRYTIAEIVDHLNEDRPHPVFDTKAITGRVDAAVANMALRKGKAVKDVLAGLEATRLDEGVIKRAKAQAKRKRKPAFPLLGQE